MSAERRNWQRKCEYGESIKKEFCILCTKSEFGIQKSVVKDWYFKGGKSMSEDIVNCLHSSF